MFPAPSSCPRSLPRSPPVAECGTEEATHHPARWHWRQSVRPLPVRPLERTEPPGSRKRRARQEWFPCHVGFSPGGKMPPGAPELHPVGLRVPPSRDLKGSWAWHPLAQNGGLPPLLFRWHGATGGQDGLPKTPSAVRPAHHALPPGKCGVTAPTLELAASPPCPFKGRHPSSPSPTRSRVSGMHVPLGWCSGCDASWFNLWLNDKGTSVLGLWG